MTLTFFDRRKIEGRLKALQETALLQLQVRFGPLPSTINQRVEAMSIEQLRELLLAFARAESLKEMGLEA